MKGAALLMLGLLTGFASQEDGLRHERANMLTIARTADELAHSSEQLRNSCPSRARFVRGLMRFTPAGEI